MKKENNTVDNFFSRGGSVKKNKKTVAKRVLRQPEVVKDKDDLTMIKGIGPVISKILGKHGVNTFAQLASMNIDDLERAVEKARGKHNAIDWVGEAKKIEGTTQEKYKNKSIGKKQLVKKSEGASAEKKNNIGGHINKTSISGTNRKKIINRFEKEDNKNFLGKIVNFLLLTLFFGVGLFFTNQTFQGINFEKIILFYLIIAVVTGSAVAKLLLKQRIKVRKTPFDRILAVFVLMYGISAWLSVDRWHSFVGFFNDPSRGFIFVMAMILSFYLIINNFTIQTAKKAFGAMVLGIVLLSIYTLIASLGLIPANIQILVPFSLVGSLKSLGAVLTIGIPVVLIAFLLLKTWKYRKIAILIQGILAVTLVSMVMNLMILKTFVSWTSLAGGLVVLVFLLASNHGKKIGGHFGRSFVFVMLGVFILLSGWAKSDYQNLIPVSSRIGLPNEVHSSLPVSFGIVKNSLMTDWKQVLIGSGPATFGYDFAKFSPKGTISPNPTVQYLYQGEGILAEAIPTIGLGGGCVVIILGVILVMQLLKKISVNSEVKMYFVGLFVAVIIALMNIISEQISGGLLIFIVLIIGLTIFFMLGNSENKEDYYIIDLRKITILRFFSALVAILFLVFLSGSSVHVVKTYLADVYFKKALAFREDNDKMQEAIKVIKLRPEEGVYYTKLGQTFLAVFDQKNKSGEIIEKEEIVSTRNSIVHYVETGASLMPNDVKTQKFLATIYEITGVNNVEINKELHRKIISLDPNSVQEYIKMGDLYLIEAKKDDNQEKFDEALEWYVKALNIQPREGVIYDRIATIYYQKGDLEATIKNLNRAIEVTPNNVSYKFTLGVLYQLRGRDSDIAVAERIFKALLTVTPNNIDILTQLGLLYEQTDHIDAAKKQYEQIIAIVEGKEKLKKIEDVFKKFIDNLNEGKLNVKKNSTSKIVDEKIEIIRNDSENTDSNKNIEAEEMDNKEVDSIEVEQPKKERVTITVGEEGPINVRSEGALTGEKLTKITETGEFEKIGENEKWVQIIIPGKAGQEEIKAWVHSKFVTE